jgi:AbrB family looped-hinge helix DNA binding protein
MMIGTTSLTRKGQITVPAKIRQLLGLRQGDRIDFAVADNRVVLQRGASVVAQTAGKLKARANVGRSAEQLREAAAQTIAAEGMARGKGIDG